MSSLSLGINLFLNLVRWPEHSVAGNGCFLPHVKCEEQPTKFHALEKPNSIIWQSTHCDLWWSVGAPSHLTLKTDLCPQMLQSVWNNRWKRKPRNPAVLTTIQHHQNLSNSLFFDTHAKICGSHSGATEDSDLLECDVVSMAQSFLSLQRIIPALIVLQ